MGAFTLLQSIRLALLKYCIHRGEEHTIPEKFLLGTSLCPKVGSNNEKAHIEYDGSHCVTSSAHGTRHLPNFIKTHQMPFVAYSLNYMPANIFHYTDWETSISPRLLKETCCTCELINDCLHSVHMPRNCVSLLEVHFKCLSLRMST